MTIWDTQKPGNIALHDRLIADGPVILIPYNQPRLDRSDLRIPGIYISLAQTMTQVHLISNFHEHIWIKRSISVFKMKEMLL